MKNNISFYILIIFLLNLIFANISSSKEQFIFNVTEVEILDDGNKFKGLKRGTIISENGVKILANNFEYNKIKNILIAEGDVKIEDNFNNYTIYSDKVIYFKNEEIIKTYIKSKAIYNELIVDADNFELNKITNVLTAEGKVEIEDKENDYLINSDKIDYFMSSEKIFSKNETSGILKSKYKIESSDVLLDRNAKFISSDNFSEILDDNLQKYTMKQFVYFFENEFLKAKNLEIISKSDVPKSESDNYKFADGFFDLKNQSFTAGFTEIFLKKNTFNDEDNDPRLYGISSNSKNQITQVEKGVFTSCKIKNGKCPPWSIQAKKITHDKNKKQLQYDNAIFKVYDYPVLYFPKFFHPDPSVKRQSGFLKPQLNQSEILGTSIFLPYFHVISENKDYTFKPSFFDNDILMLQNEYRQIDKNSSFIADFSFTKGYKSSLSSNKNSISHIFAKYNSDLNLKKFSDSKLEIFFEKTTNDTYLKVFDTNLIDIDKSIKPADPNNMHSGFKINLNDGTTYFNGGVDIYENLTVSKSSDKFQFILPHYSFGKDFFSNNFGNINLTSSGENNLSNTNNLKSRIINNINFKSYDYFLNNGLKNNFNYYLKNLNTLAKNDIIYKNSPQLEFSNIFEFESSLPMIKSGDIFSEYLEPKFSFRYNPTDMKNYSNADKMISNDNIFDINRLGIDDSFEAGKSLTIGLNYKKEKKIKGLEIDEINNYFETKIATVIRDKNEKFIPKKSTLNRKNSNIFVSITNNLHDTIKFDYDFAIDNDLKSVEYNSLNTKFIFNDFSSEITFVESNGEMGDQSVIDSKFLYEINDFNNLTFSTRRNRRINLTEYYDLLYEYKNDCLTAGIKYKKTYYQDRDVKPSEDLMLTFTFYPLTTYEQKIDQEFYRN